MLRLDAVLCGQVGREALEAISGQHMIEDHQPPEILERFLGEERREPGHGRRRLEVPLEVVDSDEIIRWRVAHIIEWKVDDHARPSVGPELGIGDVSLVTHVGESNVHRAAASSPHPSLGRWQESVAALEVQSVRDEVANLRPAGA